MVVGFATFTIAPDRRDEYDTRFAEFLVRSAADRGAGCLNYVYSVDPFDASKAYCYMHWVDHEHYEKWTRSATHSEEMERLADHGVRAVDVWHFNVQSHDHSVHEV